MAKPNLLVTYDPAHELSAKREVELLLKNVKEKATFLKSHEGVFNLRTKDARKVVVKLANLCDRYPQQFNNTFRYIPIDRWTKSNIKEMQRAVNGFAKGIDEKESWMLSVNKRRHKSSERDLIIKLTGKVNKPKVDLLNPDWIIRVEMLGKEAGFSLLKSSELLITNRYK